MSNITIVISALNAATTLATQLTALRNQKTDFSFELIVVDNGSTDDTMAVANSFRSDGVPIRVVTETRRGINFARNAGVLAANSEIVLLCDADDEVYDGWVTALGSRIDDKYWVAGALDYVGINSKQTRRIWGAPEKSSTVVTEPFRDNTHGCNCGFTKQMWSNIGGFNVAISGAGGDENEFFMRAHAEGYRQRLAPDGFLKYRLRPGVRSMMRQRYRQGRNQTRLQKLPGGAHLNGTMGPIESLGRIFKRFIMSPTYLWSASHRFAWLSEVSRHLGRLIGWWQHRNWQPAIDGDE